MNVWAVNGERGRKRQTRRRGDKGGRQDERGKMRGRKGRSRTEGSTRRAVDMRNHTAELRQMREKSRGGGAGKVRSSQSAPLQRICSLRMFSQVLLRTGAERVPNQDNNSSSLLPGFC